MTFVDSRTIGIIAAKRKFDPVKEQKYIEKAKHTRCRCKHYTQTRPCFYRTCRHFPENHYGLEKMSNLFTGEDAGYSQVKEGEYNDDYKIAVAYLKQNNVKCSCGQMLSVRDIQQDNRTSPTGKPEVVTYAHCPKCTYDLAVWKFRNHTTLEGEYNDESTPYS